MDSKPIKEEQLSGPAVRYREMQERVERPVRALQIGIVLILSSIVLCYPMIAISLYFYGIEVGFYWYLASWLPLLLGVLIGGRPAYRAVKYYRHRMRRRKIEGGELRGIQIRRKHRRFHP